MLHTQDPSTITDKVLIPCALLTTDWIYVIKSIILMNVFIFELIFLIQSANDTNYNEIWLIEFGLC